MIGTLLSAAPAPASHVFDDVPDSSTFHDDIAWLAAEGITRGCNPPANTDFCPKDVVTREQFAALAVRAFDLTEVDPGISFTDVEPDSTFAKDIQKLATAGITKGCNPPANSRFCPKDVVTREQFASFFSRALGLTAYDARSFTDVPASSAFATDVKRLATTGLTRGCNPPVNNLFCPKDPLTRETIAAFFRRAIEVLPSLPDASPSVPTVRSVLEFSGSQLLDTAVELDDKSQLPRSTKGTTWSTVPPTDWTSGFFPAALWQMFGYTGDAVYGLAADIWSVNLATIATKPDTHDLGFMVGTPARIAYELTGDQQYQAAYLTAAGTLADRYDPDVEAVRSWDFGTWSFPVIVDGMATLELLIDGAEATSSGTDEAAWRAMVAAHTDTTIANHLRGNGSTYQVVDFDPTTGAAIKPQTWSGYSDDSTWSRGQAWAIYGFSRIHLRTGSAAARDAAVDVADYFLARLPADGVPYWDFDAPGIPNEPRDSSAAAIAAAGLLRLSTQVAEPDASRYFDAAAGILGALVAPEYLSNGTNSPGILLGGTSSIGTPDEVDATLIWGDYFFIEALIHYLELVEM